MIFVRVFFRAAFFFKDEGQFIHAMKYINKSINIIKKYIKNSEDKKDLYLVEQNYTEISIGLNKYLKKVLLKSQINVYCNVSPKPLVWVLVINLFMVYLILNLLYILFHLVLYKQY